MRYTVTFELRGALAAAVAVEWTDGRDARPRRRRLAALPRLPDGRWRLAGHDSAGSAAALLARAGALRQYRPPLPPDRGRSLVAGLGRPQGDRHRRREPGRSAPRRAGRRLVGPRSPSRCPAAAARGAFVLGGAAAAAVAVQWTAAGRRPAEADWRDAVALADGRWHLGAAVEGNLDGIGRPLAAGAPTAPWSPASEDRKPLVLRRPADGAGGGCAAPALAGTGRIGAAVAALPGLWTGAPALGFEWCRDGAPIAGRDRGELPAGPRRTTGPRSAAGSPRRPRPAARAATTAGARGGLGRARGGRRRARRGDPRPGAGGLHRRGRPGLPRRRPQLRGRGRRRDGRRADRGDLDPDRRRARRPRSPSPRPTRAARPRSPSP